MHLQKMRAGWRDTGAVVIRIPLSQIAFLRGYFQGLDLANLGQRYLTHGDGRSPDIRAVKQQLQSIRAHVVAAARRHGKELHEARLLLIDPEKLSAVTAKRKFPTLEEFREERDPYEMYSESELLQIFQEEYGVTAGLTVANHQQDRIPARNQRLREGQMQALSKIERILAATPREEDDVQGWLHPALAARFEAVDIRTLRQLVDLVNLRRERWYSAVPWLGAEAAKYIEEWLRSDAVQAVPGLLLTPTPAASPTSPAVPLQNFVSADVHFKRDQDIVEGWLATKKAGNTARTYRTGAERFLLFCALELNAAPSKCDDALVHYARFLAALGREVDWSFALPMAAWIGPRHAEKSTPSWRPFAGALSPTSQQLAMDVAKQVLKALGLPKGEPARGNLQFARNAN
jgi:hypothetical protein